MKMMTAHLPDEAFEAVGAELVDLGVLGITVSEVRSASPQSAITLRYRGAPLDSRERQQS